MSTKSLTLIFLKLSNCWALITPSSAFFRSIFWERAPCQLPLLNLPKKSPTISTKPSLEIDLRLSPSFLVDTSIRLFSSSIKDLPSDLCFKKSIPTALEPLLAFIANIFCITGTTLLVMSKFPSSSFSSLLYSTDWLLKSKKYLASFPV